MTLMRSKLFVPASRPELFDKALASAADALSFDLEDAVAEDRKAEARRLLVELLARPDLARSDLAGHRKTLVVRINAPGTPEYEADIEAMALAAPDIINVPMVEDPDTIRAVAARILQVRGSASQPIRILANIESPRGLRKAAEIALADPLLMGLQIGYGDLLSPLGISAEEPSAVQHVRVAVRFAAAEAQVDAWDGAYLDIRNADGYRQACAEARQLGFAGKSCIHPSQITTANEIFRPSEAEIAHARRVVEASLAAAQNGVGAFVVDGRLIDGPLIPKAHAVLAWADRLGST